LAYRLIIGSEITYSLDLFQIFVVILLVIFLSFISIVFLLRIVSASILPRVSVSVSTALRPRGRTAPIGPCRRLAILILIIVTTTRLLALLTLLALLLVLII
jgi:hypothetical protein